MKIKKNEIENRIVTQIYLSREESTKAEVYDNIQHIGKENKNVVIYTSGNNEPKNVLENMISIIKKEMIEHS